MGKNFFDSIVATPHASADPEYLHLTAHVKNEAVAPFLFMTPRNIKIGSVRTNDKGQFKVSIEEEEQRLRDIVLPAALFENG